jgi:hypothetical protein
MKTAGYIFLAVLFAILMYVSVERFTVTITGVDSATPPVVTQMASPIPTSATSTTSTFAAPVDLSTPPPSLAPPLPPSLQPPIPPAAPVPPTTPPTQSRLAQLEEEERAAQNELGRSVRPLEDAGRAWNALPAGPEKDAALVEYSAAGQRYEVARENLERIQNELGNLRR